MNINELHPKLKKTYVKDADCGIAKSKDSKNPNLFFIVPPTPPTKIKNEFSLKKVSEAMAALHKLPTYSEMDELDKLINYLFVRREAVQSSRMEGTWSTIDEILTPASTDSNENNGQEESHETLSVRGYAHALENLFEEAYKKKETVFNLKNILKIHKEMMTKDPSYLGVAGKIRVPGQVGAVVFIGGHGRPEDSIYNPTPPEFVKISLEKTLLWFSDSEISQLGDAGMGLVLPLRMAIGHAHFEAVHPFSDGNGRVGRALWPLQMIASDVMPLYISGFVEKEKQNYYEALQLAQKKLDYSKMIDFIASAIISSTEELQNTKGKLLALPDQWFKRGNFRKNSAAFNAIHLMLKMPIFTMENLRSELGCSHQAAALAVKQLIEAKIIRERTGNKRNRLFAAEEVILLLSREHGSDANLALDKARRMMK
jgi:Fic family protein